MLFNLICKQISSSPSLKDVGMIEKRSDEGIVEHVCRYLKKNVWKESFYWLLHEGAEVIWKTVGTFYTEDLASRENQQSIRPFVRPLIFEFAFGSTWL